MRMLAASPGRLPILIMMMLILSPLGTAQTKPLTVCQVLTELDQYRGKIVTIRTLVFVGSFHGSILADYEISGECPQIAETGKHWRSAIDPVYLYPLGRIPSDSPVQFTPDYAEIEDYLDKLQEFVKKAEETRNYNFGYMATITGELRSRRDLHIFKHPDGWYAGNGYGEGGKYPAELIIKSVADLELVDIRDLHRNQTIAH
jgi:hypothetical protein